MRALITGEKPVPQAPTWRNTHYAKVKK